MDSISQAVLGASVGEAVLGKKIGNRAAILGAIGGTIPDLDVVLLPFFDGLERLSLHRGYSHSLLFCLLGGAAFAWVLGKLKWTRDISYARRWLLSFLALCTHVLLDAFTSYGTQLFLPLNDYRVSFDSVTIVDPVYTVPLLIGLVMALRKSPNSKARTWWNLGGLALSTAYLLFTLVNKQRIENEFANQLAQQGIRYEKMLTVPVTAASWKWYGVVRDSQNLYLGWYAPHRKSPIDFEKFPINEQLLDGLDPKLVACMKWFSQGFFTVAEENGHTRLYNLQCDMQGTRSFGKYRVPTAYYFEITPHPDGSYELTSGMHPKNNKE